MVLPTNQVSASAVNCLEGVKLNICPIKNEAAGRNPLGDFNPPDGAGKTKKRQPITFL
jgi:hypothetical protein